MQATEETRKMTNTKTYFINTRFAVGNLAEWIDNELKRQGAVFEKNGNIAGVYRSKQSETDRMVHIYTQQLE